MKLTLEEKEWILQRRKQKESNLPIKEAVLKHDLYHLKDGCFWDNCDEFFSKTEIEEYIVRMKSHFELSLKAGTKFICFRGEFFEEDSWYDDVCYGIENRDENWASLHLEKIKSINKSDSYKRREKINSKT